MPSHKDVARHTTAGGEVWYLLCHLPITQMWRPLGGNSQWPRRLGWNPGPLRLVSNAPTIVPQGTPAWGIVWSRADLYIVRLRQNPQWTFYLKPSQFSAGKLQQTNQYWAFFEGVWPDKLTERTSYAKLQQTCHPVAVHLITLRTPLD